MIKAHLYLLFSQLTRNDVALPNEDGLRPESFRNGLQLVFGVAGGAAMIVIAYAGFKYIASGGDPAQTAKAKDAILYALIGLAICIAAVTLIAFIRAEGGIT